MIVRVMPHKTPTGKGKGKGKKTSGQLLQQNHLSVLGTADRILTDKTLKRLEKKKEVS